jgi:hypothetical protein
MSHGRFRTLIIIPVTILPIAALTITGLTLTALENTAITISAFIDILTPKVKIMYGAETPYTN